MSRWGTFAAACALIFGVGDADAGPLHADAGPSQLIRGGRATFQLDGRTSAGAKDYRWRQVSGPTAYFATGGATCDTAVCDVEARNEGVYVFELVVSGDELRDTDRVGVAVAESPQVSIANCEAINNDDCTFLVPRGRPVWVQAAANDTLDPHPEVRWSVDKPGAGVGFLDASSARTRFIAPISGEYKVTARVRARRVIDGEVFWDQGSSEPAIMEVHRPLFLVYGITPVHLPNHAGSPPPYLAPILGIQIFADTATLGGRLSVALGQVDLGATGNHVEPDLVGTIGITYAPFRSDMIDLILCGGWFGAWRDQSRTEHGPEISVGHVIVPNNRWSIVTQIGYRFVLGDREYQVLSLGIGAGRNLM